MTRPMSPELQATLARLDAVCAEVSQMASAIADQLREARPVLQEAAEIVRDPRQPSLWEARQ